MAHVGWRLAVTRNARRLGVVVLAAVLLGMTVPPVGAAVVAAPASPNCTFECASATLTITTIGTGTGTTTGGGIDCIYASAAATGTCSETFSWLLKAPAPTVTLTMTPAFGNLACIGSACGAVNAVQTKSVTLVKGTTNTVGVAYDVVRPHLVVTHTGDGTGTVTSNPPGVGCNNPCSPFFAYNATVTLTAVADAGAVFSLWTGACFGQGATCTLTLTADTSTNAVFGLASSTSPGPTVSAIRVAVVALTQVSSTTVPARVSWTGVPGSSPILAFDLQVRVNGGSWTEIGLGSALSTSVIEHLRVGAGTQFRVRAADAAGHTGLWRTGGLVDLSADQESSSAVTYAGAWTTHSAVSDWGGHTKGTAIAGRSVTIRFTGDAIAFVAPRGPSLGSAKLYLDGVLVKTLSLHASTSIAREVMYVATFPINGHHTLRIVVLGTAGHPEFDIDGFAIQSAGESLTTFGDRQ